MTVVAVVRNTEPAAALAVTFATPRPMLKREAVLAPILPLSEMRLRVGVVKVPPTCPLRSD